MTEDEWRERVARAGAVLALACARIDAESARIEPAAIAA